MVDANIVPLGKLDPFEIVERPGITTLTELLATTVGMLLFAVDELAIG